MRKFPIYFISTFSNKSIWRHAFMVTVPQSSLICTDCKTKKRQNSILFLLQSYFRKFHFFISIRINLINFIAFVVTILSHIILCPFRAHKNFFIHWTGNFLLFFFIFQFISFFCVAFMVSFLWESCRDLFRSGMSVVVATKSNICKSIKMTSNEWKACLILMDFDQCTNMDKQTTHKNCIWWINC